IRRSLRLPLESPETGLSVNRWASRRAMLVRRYASLTARLPASESHDPSGTGVCNFRSLPMTTGLTVRRALSYAAVLVCVGLATPALSDDQELSQVIVTASRIPEPLADSFWSTTVLTRSDIEARQVQSLPDLLVDLAGVNIDNTGGLGQASAVFIRGADSDHTLLLIDGVRVGSA